jgi:hypothetical protein
MDSAHVHLLIAHLPSFASTLGGFVLACTLDKATKKDADAEEKFERKTAEGRN